MKIVVTGSSGFLGSWICRVLVEYFDVTALVRPSSDLFRLTGISNLQVVALDTSEWAIYIKENAPDSLILVDWWGVGNQDRNDLRQFDNVYRMCDLANAAKMAGVGTVIGVGSQAELGPIENEITEILSDQPTTKYGFAKAEARLKLRNIFKNTHTRFVWMRIFSTYGPLDTGNWLIPQTVDAIRSGQRMALTKGEQEWSYLHAYDLAMAFKLAVEVDEIAGIVNVGNPVTISIKNAVNTIGKILNEEKLLNFGAVEYRQDQVMKLKPLCEKLTSVGWKPEISFNDGISQTIKWLTGENSNQLKTISGSYINFDLPARL